MQFGLVLVLFVNYSNFIHRLKTVSATHTPFEIITHRQTVVNLAVEHAKHKQSRRNAVIGPVVGVVRKTICDKKAEAKVALCHRFLPMYYMGFEFASWNENDFTCLSKKFWISHPPNPGEDSFELEMYSCPDIKYRDLKTDQDVVISDKYHVSEGKKHDSAILFFQKDKNDENDKIYPKKYINNVVFKQLVLPEAKSREKMKPKGYPNRKIIEFEVARRMREPYTKFKKTFASMIICNLPKAHKIHLCRQGMTFLHLWNMPPLDIEVYDQHRCRRHRMRSPLDDLDYYIELGESRPEQTHSPLLLCPTDAWQPGEKKIKTFFYLFSNLEAYSFTILSRDNDWGTKFVRERIIYDVDPHDMVRDRRRVRNMIYPTEVERKEELLKSGRNDLNEFEEALTFIKTSVRTPITMAKAGEVNKPEKPDILTPVSIVRIEPLVEDIFISFSKIKAMKFVYLRFMKTHSSLDICPLPHIVKKALCDNILKQPLFEYYPIDDEEEKSNERFYSPEVDLSDTYQVHAPDTNIDRSCSRREVTLGIREVETLEAQYFALWQCPKAEVTSRYPPTYYITKHHLKNSLILLKTGDTMGIPNDDIIFPEAVATKIQREILAQIVLHDMTEN